MKNGKLVVTLVAFMLLVAACGGKSAEEELLEQLIESSGEDIGNVDLNTDSDGNMNITIEGEDGESINITGSDGSDDGDVNFTIEGDDGEEISISGSGDDEEFTITVDGDDGGTMTIGSGEIPEGLNLPVLDGGDVVSSFVADDGISLTIIYPIAAYDGLVSLYEDQLPSGENVMHNNSSQTDEDGTHRAASWIGETFLVTVYECEGMDSDQYDSACVNLSEFSS